MTAYDEYRLGIWMTIAIVSGMGVIITIVIMNNPIIKYNDCYYANKQAIDEHVLVCIRNGGSTCIDDVIHFYCVTKPNNIKLK